MSAPSHQANTFDLLRILAALGVVAGHAYVLSGRAADEPLVRFTQLTGLGELGVSVFFVISGYLVAGSYERLGRPKPYLVHRLLRILPGLAVATVLTAFVLGPLVSATAPGAYFTDARTWLYPLRNTALYPVTYVLPGVFDTNPYPVAVNGSLWTLRLEFTFYLLMPALAALGSLNRAGLTCVAALAGGACLVLLLIGPDHAPAQAVIGARNLYLFAAGGALFAWRDRFHPASPVVLGASIAVFLIGALVVPALALPVTPLVVVGLALIPLKRLSGPLPFGDLSYGVYIYAFPVQQALMHWFGPRMGVGPFLAATLICVLPLAAASWWLVERPALKLKRLADAPAPTGEPATA